MTQQQCDGGETTVEEPQPVEDPNPPGPDETGPREIPAHLIYTNPISLGYPY